MSVFAGQNVTNIGREKFFCRNLKLLVRAVILPVEKLPLEKGVKHYEEIYRSFSEGTWIFS